MNTSLILIVVLAAVVGVFGGWRLAAGVAAAHAAVPGVAALARGTG